ncbi:MAG: type VI secretion system tip protein TssI/VgrG, partial [Byssovorax sp.]
MSEQPLIYWFETGGRRWRAREVKGTEAIARPFRFEIAFRLDLGESFDPDAVVAADAALELRRGEVVRRIDAVVTSSDVTAQLTGVAEIRVVIEPRLALARERVDIRLFRDRTAPEIVVEVLSALGIATELRLAEVYERRPYCVQHRESDLDFVQRLLEDEGIFYYFIPGDVMVLGDSPAAYQPIPGASTLPFRAGLGMDHQSDDAIIAVGSCARLTPRKVTLRDFNPETPKLDMQVEAATRCPGGPEWYDYPGEYAAPPVGQRKARLRAEAIDCSTASLKGRSLCGRLMPGCTFTLLGAPPPVESRGQVVTRVEHAWSWDRGGFSSAFEAQGDDVAFRPPLETVAPTLVNPVTGFVTGPPGEDIHT